MTSAPTILYVEDESDDVFFMQAAFKRAGVVAEVHAAIDGGKAIAYLDGQAPYSDRAKYPLPALILLDLNLPIKSGFEVLEWLRQRTEFKPLPVIVFSSSGRPEDRARAHALGATDYLQKPSSGTQFGEIVRTVRERWLRNERLFDLDRSEGRIDPPTQTSEFLAAKERKEPTARQ